MTGEVHAHDRDADALLQARIRLGVGAATLAMLAFGLADLRLGSEALGVLWGLKIVGLAVAAAILWRLRTPRPHREMVAIAVAAIALAMVLTAAGGVAVGDHVTTPLLCVTLALAAATLLPWGTVAQSLVAALAVATIVGHGLWLGDPGYPALAGVVVALLSFYVAHALERQRRALANEQRKVAATQSALRDSERRFELILQHSSDGVVVVDEPGIIRYVSSAAERLFGLTADRLIGRQASEFMHPDDLEGVLARFVAAGSGGTVRVEYRMRRDDGSWVDVETAGTVLVADPAIGGTVLSLRDVSDRRRMQAELRASDERYRATFDHAAIGIAHVAPDGRWLRVNRRLCEIVGYTAEELDGKTFQDITYAEDLEADLAYVGEMLAGRRSRYAMEKRYVRSDGALVWVMLSVALVRDPDGTPRYFISVVEDISERKRAEARIQALNEELQARSRALEDANREMEAFNYSVSHDLRAPLRAIDGFSRILQEDHGSRLEPEARTHLERVRAAAARMFQIIDDLLLLGQINRREPLRRPVDVSALAEAIAADLREAAPQRRTEIAVTPGLTATADPNLLRVLLDNLLGNAWKYTSRRAPGRIELDLVAQRDGGTALCVRDDGAGFDMSYADRLFRPFQRLHSPDEFEGTGIGLAIVQRIVQRHGGRIWAEAEPDRGAAFFFTLGPDGIETPARPMPARRLASA